MQEPRLSSEQGTHSSPAQTGAVGSSAWQAASGSSILEQGTHSPEGTWQKGVSPEQPSSEMQRSPWVVADSVSEANAVSSEAMSVVLEEVLTTVVVSVLLVEAVVVLVIQPSQGTG